MAVVVMVVVVVTTVRTPVEACEYDVTRAVTVTKAVEEQEVVVVVELGAWTVKVKETVTVSVSIPFCCALELPWLVAEGCTLVVAPLSVDVTVLEAAEGVLLKTR